jgi:hypothetical protein
MKPMYVVYEVRGPEEIPVAWFDHHQVVTANLEARGYLLPSGYGGKYKAYLDKDGTVAYILRKLNGLHHNLLPLKRGS